MDTAPCDKMMLDPAQVRAKEGISLSKSLFQLKKVMESLASREERDFAPLEGSKLTRILSDALGGNCVTTVCGFLVKGEFEINKCVLELLKKTQMCETYPVVSEDKCLGLLRRYRLITSRLRDEVSISLSISIFSSFFDLYCSAKREGGLLGASLWRGREEESSW